MRAPALLSPLCPLAIAFVLGACGEGAPTPDARNESSAADDGGSSWPDAAKLSASDAGTSKIDGSTGKNGCSSIFVSSLGTPACDECSAANCCAQAEAIDADPDYAALTSCTNTCDDSNPSCRDACWAAHPAAVQDYKTFAACNESQCDLPCNHNAPSAQLVHLAPAQGPLDWCFRSSGSSTWQGPNVLGAGQTYKTISNALQCPAAGSVDIAVIALDGSCDAPLAAQSGVAVSLDHEYDLAVIGSAPLLRILDHGAATSHATARLRFFDAAETGATVAIGAGTYDPNGALLPLGTMSFGAPWTGMNVSVDGFFEVTSPPSNYPVWFTSDKAGGSYDAFLLAGYSTTVYAIPAKSGVALVRCGIGSCG